MPTRKPLIRKFQNYVFLNAYANVYQMHTISFPVYFLKVRYSSEAVCIRPPHLTLYKICILYVVVVAGEQPEEAMTV